MSEGGVSRIPPADAQRRACAFVLPLGDAGEGRARPWVRREQTRSIAACGLPEALACMREDKPGLGDRCRTGAVPAPPQKSILVAGQ